ncbi:hypothetical protein [Streptosporangium sp. NPDC000396]|uniref:hypothetical protein n=1 Tax=Streptosporangium sp. NPDC000396 TaxID=3366185 RepID=UPI00369F7533
MPPDIETIAEQVFIALADPSRRAILAALARDWDDPLHALKDHLDRSAGGATTTPLHESGEQHG